MGRPAATCSAARGSTAPIRPMSASAGLVARPAATDGWTPVSVPNSYNAGDLSSARHARLRRLVPPGLHASARRLRPYVSAADRRWIVRFESVNYRATVWLNGRRSGAMPGPTCRSSSTSATFDRGVNRLIVRVDNRRSPWRSAPGPGRRLVELRRHPTRGLSPRRTAGRRRAGAGEAAAAVPDLRGDDRRSRSSCATCRARAQNCPSRPGATGRARSTSARRRIAPHATWTGAGVGPDQASETVVDRITRTCTARR